MGYIELSTKVPDAKKAVISLWFRVPSASITAATEQWQAFVEGGGDRKPLTGIIPLMIFGDSKLRYQGFEVLGTNKRNIGRSPDNVFHRWNFTTGAYEAQPFGTGIFDSTLGGPIQALFPTPNGKFTVIDPSHIGVDCTGDYPALSVNINLPVGNKPKGSGLLAIGTSENGGPSNTFDGGGAGTFVYGTNPTCVSQWQGGQWTRNTIIDNTSFLDVFLGDRVETIRLLRDGGNGPSGQRVTPDHWHHLLLSFDLSDDIKTKSGSGFQTINAMTFPGTVTNSGDDPGNYIDKQGKGTTSAARIWVAFDDVNLTKKDLSFYYPTGFSDPNAVLPILGYTVASGVSVSSTSFGPDCHGNIGTVNITTATQNYSLSPEDVPLGRVGLPATSDYVDNIRHVEMGELMMFLDTTLDPSSVVNRRAFITDNGKPTDVIQTVKYMGKQPEVELHKTAKWKNGINTGSLAFTPPEKGISVGDIKTYRPNPNLHGKQGT